MNINELKQLTLACSTVPKATKMNVDRHSNTNEMSRARDVARLNGLLSVCHLIGRRHLASVAVVLSVLVTVYLVSQYCISTTKLTLLFINRTLNSDSCSMSTWSGNVSESDSASVITVHVDANFTDRVACFNVQLQHLRHQLLLTPHTINVCNANNWISARNNLSIGHGATPLRVVRGVEENYMDKLSDNPDIITVVLPWFGSRSNWSSLTDFSNVLYQHYFEWTADNVLCTWIERPGVIKMHYDVLFRRTCNRNVNDTATARSLRPLFFNAKPAKPGYHWPNSGNLYPDHFYTSAPRYVFYVHVHQNAIVTPLGDVITANTKLVLDACSHDISPTTLLHVKLSQIPCYDEIYVITQYWGNAVFHRMAEIVPRLVLCLRFLNLHPEIRILAPQVEGRIAELLKIIGLAKTRLVTGVARAKIVYQPRSTGCGYANVHESQVLSQLYRDYIKQNFPAQPRNRLILIRRSRSRRFSKQRRIHELLKSAAKDYNLTYTLFNDNPTPSLNDTMMMFHSAVIIVAPVGAGESNMYFSQPGTYVVEGVCNLPHVNMCFQRLAHILGHHWHGVTSRRGCEAVVDVSAASIDDAVRRYLRLWKLERS